MGVFDVSQSVINNAGGLIAGSTEVTVDMMAEFEDSLWEMNPGPLLGLWLQTFIVGITMHARDYSRLYNKIALHCL